MPNHGLRFKFLARYRHHINSSCGASLYFGCSLASRHLHGLQVNSYTNAQEERVTMSPLAGCSTGIAIAFQGTKARDPNWGQFILQFKQRIINLKRLL
eukprot:6175742-Pleurochrysis_carterae.AAC.7